MHKEESNHSVPALNSKLEITARYNFDEIIDRHHTNAIKIERSKALFGTENVLPLWVADMDFATPDFIVDALKDRCEHPIFGYTKFPENYFEVIIDWIKNLHNWEVNRKWIGYVPGIVTAIAFAIEVFSEPGDEIIIQPPVYYPFMDIINKAERKLINNQLVEKKGRYEMDFDDLEQRITSKSRIFIMSNPHNPGGRAWDFKTLNRLSELCAKHNILIISDEIHSDIILYNHKHCTFATVSETAANNSITFIAPTKTFNIPGLLSSSYIIPNTEIRLKYQKYLEKMELTGSNIFSAIATKAAYTSGNIWRQEMIQYVQQNIDYLADFLRTNIPEIKPMIPEASYLVWLNCKDLGMETNELHSFFAHKAGIGLNKGSVFGPGGEYHLRINVACPRSVLQLAMNQLQNAVCSKQ